jgi:hypothetical protein
MAVSTQGSGDFKDFWRKGEHESGRACHRVFGMLIDISTISNYSESNEIANAWRHSLHGRFNGRTARQRDGDFSRKKE